MNTTTAPKTGPQGGTGTPPTKRVADPELIAMNELSKAIEKIGGTTRTRVLKWFAEKYGVLELVKPPTTLGN